MNTMYKNKVYFYEGKSYHVTCGYSKQVEAALTTDPGNEELKKLKQDLEVSLSFRSLKFWPQILGFVHCFLYELVQLVELGLADLDDIYFNNDFLFLLSRK